MGKIIHVDLDISESQHRHQYARETAASDPAAHLGVRITGKDAQGNTFVQWLSSGGRDHSHEGEHTCRYVRKSAY